MILVCKNIKDNIGQQSIPLNKRKLSICPCNNQSNMFGFTGFSTPNRRSMSPLLWLVGHSHLYPRHPSHWRERSSTSSRVGSSLDGACWDGDLLGWNLRQGISSDMSDMLTASKHWGRKAARVTWPLLLQLNHLHEWKRAYSVEHVEILVSYGELEPLLRNANAASGLMGLCPKNLV
jgi:hypothetical protein